MMLNRDYSDNALSIALALSAAAWGLYWIPLRTIEDAGISGVWSVVFFNACPLLVLLPLLLFKLKTLKNVFFPTLLAAVMIGTAFNFYANGLLETTVTRATLLYYLTPIWSTIIGVWWLSEPLTKARVYSILIAFGGLLLLLSADPSSNHPLNIGDLYSLLSGMFWAVGVATLNRWPKIPILPLTTFIFLSTTALSTMFAGLLYNAPLPELSMLREAFPTAAFWSIIILLPCVCIIFRASQSLFPGRVGILTMTEVVVAVGSAAILLPNETMSSIQWIGAVAIVMAGVIEVVFGYSRSSAATVATDSR